MRLAIIVQIRQRAVLIVLGFVILWLLLETSAGHLRSYRGEWGLVVTLLVVVAAILWEQLIGHCGLRQAACALGFRRSLPAVLAWTAALSLVLLCFLPAYALLTGMPFRLREGWLLLLPGLFAQGGIAEEVVFRGYLFRHIRNYLPFGWSAAWTALPFVMVHLLLFKQLDFHLALTSILLAFSLSFPPAWLFESSGESIWPPAILHFVVQGAIKIVDVPSGQFLNLTVAWMIASLLVPWLVFLRRRGQ